MHINVKMPTMVGILAFMCRVISCSVEFEHGKGFITSSPVYEMMIFTKATVYAHADGLMSKLWSDSLSTTIPCICKQRRIWRAYVGEVWKSMKAQTKDNTSAVHTVKKILTLHTILGS